MKNWRTAVLPLLLCCTMGVCFPLAGCAESGVPGPPPAVGAAATQTEALRQAQTTDLPALSATDRVVISSAPPPIGNGRSIELRDAGRIRHLLDTLKPKAVPPSSGMQAATVRFYRGTNLLREVWVYIDGEWGFVRPGTQWTTGQSDELAALLRKELNSDAQGREQ